uniref:Uncharacterized protein n=1 Tax=Trypanosoma congolense (strain IL3000) TaxID=1068625 RepID=G0URS0_TRYCI|nr:conserved hypothetical protein [Trypanosoma congolense IL3000]
MHHTPLCFRGFFVSAVRCAFIADVLYGCRYSPHIGMCHIPHVYVKIVLFCASRSEGQQLERGYMRGLIEHLVACDVQPDVQTKLDLMRFVDAMPAAASLTSSSGSSDGSSDSHVVGIRDGSIGGENDGITSFFMGSLFPAVLGHVLLYDAVCACTMGGPYDKAARDRVAQVAAKLGVSQHGQEVIEKTAMRERRLAALKRQLLLLPDVPPSC